MEIDFESVRSSLDGFIDGEKRIFGVLAFESSMGDSLRQTGGLAVNG
jgi:hypothetical protein